MSGYSHTLLVSAGGEVQLLLDLLQPILGDDGVIVGVVEGRGPQLEETLQLPLEVIQLPSVAVKDSLSQSL
jgi:hypothetical protein